MMQMWMFVTPIIYPLSFIPIRWRWILKPNPLSGVIEGFRDAIFGRPFHWQELWFSAAVTLVLLLYNGYSFRRMEREFADVI
jgi:lipopolysaccharide transport system permease protein